MSKDDMVYINYITVNPEDSNHNYVIETYQPNHGLVSRKLTNEHGARESS